VDRIDAMTLPFELPVREGYAAWSSCYDEDGNPLIALEGPAVAARFGGVAGRRVLDVGCGTGRHTRSLVERGALVTAIDCSPEMMGRARLKLCGEPVNWVRHALPAPLPFAAASFHLVVMGLVAEHVQALAEALMQIGRVIVPGGRCLLSALHPERTAAGERARFIDPLTGERRPIATIHRTVGEYLAAADSAGLRLLEEETLVVPADLGQTHPRAARYVGQPLGWIGCWSRPF
jgi:malonyl-CoA O-methyltransferase